MVATQQAEAAQTVQPAAGGTTAASPAGAGNVVDAGQVLDKGLFASLDPPRLLGSRCRRCDTVVFPVAGSCPRCASEATEPTPLPERGTVWTWTVQTFAPRAPYVPPADGFVPFAVGYVDLGAVLVESLLLGDPDELRIGLPVRLTLTPVGAGSVTFAFAPDGDAA